jgi:branched-chain amino acid transport system ATP-binding protein|tara:strand:- start:61 stop:819 length:759 start_codon:yes stop_codon:yes gene_type:complete
MSFFEAKNITVSFGGIKALNNVSFKVNKGEVFTIIGPNGAGKSTLFNVISRIYQPQSGEVIFENKNLLNSHAHNIIKDGIARTFQNLELFENATVLQNLLLGRHIYKRSNFLSDLFFLPSVKVSEKEQRLKVEEVIDFLNLQHYRDTPIHGLPYGIRKNVELARALSTEPKLLLLDEPSSGLTNEETIDLGFWIKDIQSLLNITVIMIEHDMSFVHKVSDRILALNYGEILAEGLPSEIQSNKEVKKAYMGE